MDEINKTSKQLRDGEPCGHPGCLAHTSHPCEVCGRIGGRMDDTDKKIEEMAKQLADEIFDFGIDEHAKAKIMSAFTAEKKQIEQRTKEACKKIGRTALLGSRMNPFSVSLLWQMIRRFEQAIDEARIE